MKLIIILLVGILSGCSVIQPSNIPHEYVDVTIVSIHRTTTELKIGLRDLSTGGMYQVNSYGFFCSVAEHIRVGERYVMDISINACDMIHTRQRY